MSGKILAVVILACALIAGGAMYYLQVYHFYDEVAPQDMVTLTRAADGALESVPVTGFRGIDSASSPIRYRACFDIALAPDEAAARFAPYAGAAPRVAPGWFDCFDAEAIGAAMDAGSARVFVGRRNIEFGIDRVVALTDDGRGYVWHEVNECGDKAYDGSPLGEDCPPRNGDR